MKIAVIIPAAGSSTRFGSQDKLSQDLGGRALLLRTVELFTKRPEVDTTIVAAPPDRLGEFKLKYGDQLGFHGVQIVAGGTEARWETVKNALDAVPDDATHIAVHDAARPATPPELIDSLLEAAKVLDAVIPTVAVSNTIKRLGTDTIRAEEVDPIAAKLLGEDAPGKKVARPVIETIDRERLVEVQTPQVFKADLLRRAYAQDDLSGATDDASLVERLGETVHAIEGDSRNIKITFAADLDLVRKIMNVGRPKERAAHKRF